MVKKYDYRYFFVLLILLAGIVFRCLSFSLLDKKVDIMQISTYTVVEVKASTESVGESFGSAVFVKDDGTLITNAHVVTYKNTGITMVFDSISIRFSTENDYRDVFIEKYDLEKDLAVLKLKNTDCKFKTVKFANSLKIKENDDVYAVGNLNNVGISVTKGIVSNKKINVKYNEITREVIQCDLTIAEGNSGGALFNLNGELIGITTFRLKDSSSNVIYGICYCIPSNIVVEYIK